MFIYQIIKSSDSFVEGLGAGLAFVIVGVISIVMHEFAHAFIAYKNGDLTAKLCGRLSLNPGKHFDPIGSLLLILVGFGWAKPVPINTSNFRNYKSGLFFVSVAGIVTNILIALLNLMILFFTAHFFLTVFSSNNFATFVIAFLFSYICLSIRINFIMAMFNLLPIYPLDGYNGISAILADKFLQFSYFMVKYGRFILFALIALSYIGRATNIKWLDIFGSFDQLILDLMRLVLQKGAQFGVK